MTDSTIQTARLGASGPEVGVQGLGCMGMSFAYGPVDAKASRQTLERALELGVTLYDTADAYGQGENEKFLSPFFMANRDNLVIATKFALSIPPDEPTRRVIRNDAPYIRQAVEASLRRLDVDVIDLYYMHRRDVNVPIEETVATMAELVREGKVKQLGLSEVNPGRRVRLRPRRPRRRPPRRRAPHRGRRGPHHGREATGDGGRDGGGAADVGDDGELADLCEHRIRERRPHLDRPRSEVPIRQSAASDPRVGIDPQERARLTEVAEGARGRGTPRPVR